MREPFLAPVAPVDGHHVEFGKLEEGRDGGARIAGGGDSSSIGSVFETTRPEIRKGGDDGEDQGVAGDDRIVKEGREEIDGEHSEKEAAHGGVAELGGMLELEVREFVSHDVVDFTLRHALEKVVGEGNCVAGAGESIGDLSFAGRDEVDLLKFDANAFGHSKSAIAEISGGKSLRLHAGEFEQSLSSNSAKKESSNPPEQGAAESGATDHTKAGEKHGEWNKSREDGVESLEREFAFGPTEAAEFLLNWVGDAIAEEPKNRGRNPSDGFVKNGMSGQSGETRAGSKEAKNWFGVAVVESNPPAE